MIAFLLQAGAGGGDGNEGWSLGAVISILLVSHTLQRGSKFQCWFFASLSQLPACDCVSRKCPKALCCPDKRVQDPCVGSQVNLAVYTSLGLFPGRICQAWLVFTLAIWSFLSPSHTPAVPPIWIVGPLRFFSLTAVIS